MPDKLERVAGKKPNAMEGGEALLLSYFERHPIILNDVKTMIGVFIKAREGKYGSFKDPKSLKLLSAILGEREFQTLIDDYLKSSGRDETRAEFRKVFSDLTDEVKKPELSNVTYDDLYSFCIKARWVTAY